MSNKYTSLEHIAKLIHEGKTNLLTPRKNAGGQSPAYTEHAGYTGVYKSKSMGSSVAAGRARSMPYTSGANMTEDGAVPNEGNATPTAKAYGSFDEDGKKKKVVKEDEEEAGDYFRKNPPPESAVTRAAENLPVISQAKSLKSAIDNVRQGKYKDAALDIAGEIPKVGLAVSAARGAGIVKEEESALKDFRTTARKALGIEEPSTPEDIAKDDEKMKRVPAAAAAGALLLAPGIGRIAGSLIGGGAAATATGVAADALTGGSSSSSVPSTNTYVPSPVAPQTSAPKTGVSSQYSPKRSRTVREEAEGSKDRKTIENVARRDSATSPFDRKSKLAKNAEIKSKIIDENKKLVDVVKKTKEEASAMSTKKKEYDNVIFNPSLNKPDVGTTNNSY